MYTMLTSICYRIAASLAVWQAQLLKQASDAADLTENIEHELAIGGFIGVQPEETIEPIRKLKRLAAEKGYRLIPGHDPHVWPELTQHFHDRFSLGRQDAT